MRRNMSLMALLTTTAVVGFDWKMDGDALAVDGEGNPIWINGDKELSVKGDTISSLQGEAKRHRIAKEAAEASLAKFDGLDADAARTALDTVKDIDTSKLINAGKLDEVRSELTRQFESKITAAETKAAEATKRADNTLLDNAFNSSEFARSRLTEAGIDLARAQFGNRFRVEDGKVVAYDSNGQVVYSDKNLGEPATFDEALEKTVGTYKYKDQILKAPDAAGSGSGGAGGSRGRGRSITRADFEALPPVQQAEIAGKVGSGEMSFAD